MKCFSGFLAFDVKCSNGSPRFSRVFFPFVFQTETALIYDAVQMFARALTDLDRSQDVQPVSIDCTGRETWQHGNSLVNFMKMVCELFILSSIAQ